MKILTDKEQLREKLGEINESITPTIKISSGDHKIKFYGKFSGSDKAKVQLEFRCIGEPEAIHR